MSESPVERLIKTNPDMEIWWDSSPLVFNQWANKMVNAAEPSRQAILKDQLSRLYNMDHPAESLFRGCTTNPPLSWAVVQNDPKYWAEWVAQQNQTHPELNQKQLAWLT